MARSKNKSTRRNRKQRGGGMFDFIFGKKPEGTEVAAPTTNVKPSLFERFFGSKKSNSVAPAANPVSLQNAQPVQQNASSVAPTAPTTAPAAVGGRRRKATRKSKGKKSRKSKTSRRF